MTSNAQKWLFARGAIPTGHMVENKKYVIDEKAASLINELFERHTAGDALRTIFITEGYKYSNPFSPNSLSKALKTNGTQGSIFGTAQKHRAQSSTDP